MTKTLSRRRFTNPYVANSQLKEVIVHLRQSPDVLGFAGALRRARSVAEEGTEIVYTFHNFSGEAALARLLAAANQGLSPRIENRYDALARKQREGSLSEEEHQEMLALVKQIEAANVRRTKALIELARLRGVSLSDVLSDPRIRDFSNETDSSIPVHV